MEWNAEWIIYFSVLLITVCKEEKERADRLKKTSKISELQYEIHKLLISVLEELKKIAELIKSYDDDDKTKQEKRNKIKNHLQVIERLLHDPNAFYGQAVVPVGVGVGTLTLATIFHVAAPVIAVGTIVMMGLTYFAQRQLNQGRNIVDELKHAITRAIEEIDKKEEGMKMVKNNCREIGERIDGNLFQAKQHLAFTL